MKVLLINGSPKSKGCTFTALHEVEKELNNQGIDTVIVDIPYNVDSCLACNNCHATHQGCFKNDIINETYKLLDEADGIVVGSPVYYAGPSGSLLSFLDRLFYSYPHKKSLNMKAAASISNSRRAGNITTNDVISKFFSISGMSIITSTYWNDTHGFKPDELDKDEEGMQTMRNLGKNMAYYIKMRKLAQENNLEDPILEKDKVTNFVR